MRKNLYDWQKHKERRANHYEYERTNKEPHGTKRGSKHQRNKLKAEVNEREHSREVTQYC